MSTVVAKPVKSHMTIRSYVDKGVENMGLELYGLSMFDGAIQVEPLGFIDTMGVNNYITGLNENVPEIQKLPQKEKEAAIKDIRETAAKVFKMITSKEVDPAIKNTKFWEECDLLAPTNAKFWGRDVAYPEGFTLALSTTGMDLDMTKPMDILIERAIKSGGYKVLIADSLEAARERPNPPKFYLDRLTDTAATNTEVRKLTNKAKSELETLRDTDVDKLIMIARNFDPDCVQYRNSTPADIVYLNMDKGIDGELWERNKRQAAKTFLDLCRLPAEELYIKAIIKVATKFRFVDQKADGYIYFMEEGNVLGRNPEEVYLFLKNPIHDDILAKLQAKVNFEMER